MILRDWISQAVIFYDLEEGLGVLRTDCLAVGIDGRAHTLSNKVLSMR